MEGGSDPHRVEPVAIAAAIGQPTSVEQQDALAGRGVFVIGKEVLLDDVVIGSLATADTSPEKEKPEDLLACAKPLNDPFASWDSFLGYIPEDSEDEDVDLGEEFSAKPMATSAAKRIKIRLKDSVATNQGKRKRPKKSGKDDDPNKPPKKRGRPSKADIKAKNLANGGVISPSPPKQEKPQKRPKKKEASEETKNYMNEVGKRNRDRVAAAIELMRSNLPGISSNSKLDKANVLDMAVSYIMFIQKHQYSIEDINREYVLRYNLPTA